MRKSRWDVTVGSETIEITTVRFERSQVLELFRETSRPLDSTVIPWRAEARVLGHAKAP